MDTIKEIQTQPRGNQIQEEVNSIGLIAKKLNFEEYISNIDNQIRELMNSKYNQEDSVLWIVDNQDTELTVRIMCSEIVSFSDNSTYLAWEIRVSTLIPPKSDKSLLVSTISDVLELLDHKAIKDEDLVNSEDGIISITEDSDFITACCWFIPGIPDGVWENHSLPSTF